MTSELLDVEVTRCPVDAALAEDVSESILHQAEQLGGLAVEHRGAQPSRGRHQLGDLLVAGEHLLQIVW
jgi:hypothetical protein